MANRYCDRQDLRTMNTNPSPPLDQQPPPRRRRLCGICKAAGHDRRNCPDRPAIVVPEVVEIAVNNQNAVTESVVPPPAAQPAPPMAPRVNWEECLYVLFDLETTGLSRDNDDIIEFAAVIVGSDSVMIEDGTFQSFVRPRKQISNFITILTGIDDEMVAMAPPFATVAQQFFDFIQTSVEVVETTTEKKFHR